MTGKGDPVVLGTAEVLSQGMSGGRWEPKVGLETEQLLKVLPIPDGDGANRLVTEAVGILSRCIDPHSGDASSTGITLGYVQSGKTSSFTVVTALARDNDFPLVVVIAGTSIPLFNQSDRRLKKDLRIDDRKDRAWMHISNPTIAAAQRLRGPLKDWRHGEANGQVVLLTVMKNHIHLQDLNDLLRNLDVDDIPALIIDDEADQASLNTQARTHQQSTTYRALLELRSAIPRHTFLQYTATPQAPLLINLIDVLSPSFARVLTPGDGYTGGRRFFLESPEVIRIIPDSELPIPANNLSQPPPTLLEALRLFYLGVAAAFVEAGGVPDQGNRSMLIHPSQGVTKHGEYEKWVLAIRDLWVHTLRLPETDPDRADLLEEFKDSASDLRRTLPHLAPTLELATYLDKAIERTVITLMNSTPKDGTPGVPWRDTYSHILIGGQAMDRGFTVEGLTVTYMPRSVGVRNVDTVQQRARFFGYKAEYFGFCRVFLEREAAEAYRNYLDHEESIREELRRHGDRPLSEWKRAFLLDSNYRPTRRNVLGIDYVQGGFADKWFRPSAPHRDPQAVASNQSIIDDFVSANGGWKEDTGDPKRTPVERHLVTESELSKVLAALLAPLRMIDPNDSVKFTGLLLEIRTFLDDNPDEMAVVYRMSKGLPRMRSTNDQDEIINLHQGRNPRTGPVVYPGDERIRFDDRLSAQIHNLSVNGKTPAPAVAVWLPARMSGSWLVQK